MTEKRITPPPELVEQWRAASSNVPASLSTDPGGRRDYIDYIATQAAQWGADQELEACCEWLSNRSSLTEKLRDVRRPKPLSPKEEALQVLEDLIESRRIVDPEYQALRHALEQLDD